MQITQGQHNLSDVELHFALFEPAAVALQMGKQLATRLVVDDEEEVGRRLKAVKEPCETSVRNEQARGFRAHENLRPTRNGQSLVRANT